MEERQAAIDTKREIYVGAWRKTRVLNFSCTPSQFSQATTVQLAQPCCFAYAFNAKFTTLFYNSPLLLDTKMLVLRVSSKGYKAKNTSKAFMCNKKQG